MKTIKIYSLNILLVFMLCSSKCNETKKDNQQVDSSSVTDKSKTQNQAIVNAATKNNNTAIISGEDFTNAINKNWKLISAKNKKIESDEKMYVVRFKDENTVFFSLDKNNCEGTYTYSSNKVNFKLTGCTEMCCDSEEAKAIGELFWNVTNFKFDKEALILYTDEYELVCRAWEN